MSVKNELDKAYEVQIVRLYDIFLIPLRVQKIKKKKWLLPRKDSEQG